MSTSSLLAMPAALLILYCSQVEEQVTTVGTDGSGVVIASRAGFVWRLGAEAGSDAAWSPATGTVAPLKDHVLQVGLLCCALWSPATLACLSCVCCAFKYAMFC
jgi:hypothetical protein